MFPKELIITLMQSNAMIVYIACCIDGAMQMFIAFALVEFKLVGLHAKIIAKVTAQ